MSKLVGNHGPVLCKSVGIKPNFLPLSRMGVLKNFGLVFRGNFIRIPNVIKIAGRIGLGAFLIMETKEETMFFCEVDGKQFHDWCSFLATKKTSFGEVHGSSYRIEFPLFDGMFASGSSQS
jgi:hypothetical protein